MTNLILMNIDNETVRKAEQSGLTATLGIKFLPTPEADTCAACMKASEATGQPFGFLSGGATLALAETLAGMGSMLLCEGCICVGVNVSGNHLRAVPVGDNVTAYGRLLHKGRNLHQWQVDVKNAKGQLVSSVSVTNYIANSRKS